MTNITYPALSPWPCRAAARQSRPRSPSSPGGSAAAAATRGARSSSGYRAKGATLDDLRESVETLEDAERIAQRALGGAHPLTKEIKGFLQQARFVLRGYSLLPYGASAVAVAVIAWVWRRFLT